MGTCGGKSGVRDVWALTCVGKDVSEDCGEECEGGLWEGIV